VIQSAAALPRNHPVRIGRDVCGGWGHSRFGYTPHGHPLGIVRVVLVILWATGNIGCIHHHLFR
jgi:hypothetical protein